MAHAWWSFYSLYMGEREKNTKINVTFSLSGWAMPFPQRRPGLWPMLRLSPQTESPWSVCLHRVRRKANIPGIPAGCSYLQAPGSALQTRVTPAPRRTRLVGTHACRRRPCRRVETRTESLPNPGGSTNWFLTLRMKHQPAAVCLAEKSLAVLTHSDKIHFIGFVLKFDIGSWDSNFYVSDDHNNSWDL